jgi:hypothetical protein
VNRRSLDATAAIAACAVALMHAAVAAQNNWLPHLKALPGHVITPPKTPEGWPDLQGKWRVSNRIGGPQHSIEHGIDPQSSVIHDWNRKAREASVVIDPPNGLIPYNETAMPRRNEYLKWVYTPIERQHIDPEARCLLGGVPRATLQGAEIRYAPPFVVFANLGRTSDMGGYTRVIPMDGRPFPNDTLKLTKGVSRGHWEGHTLVVETRNQNDKTWFDSHGSFHSDQIKVIERITMVDADTMYYRATIVDPGVFTQPWTLATTWNRAKNESDRQWEEGCWEGERDVEHMLEAGRRAYAAGHRGIHEHKDPDKGEQFAPAVKNRPALSTVEGPARKK